MSNRTSTAAEDDRPVGGEIDLRALGRGLWRRRFWILGPALVVAVLAFLFVELTSPYYRATALVLIENRDQLAPGGGGQAPQLPDEQAVATQVQLIQSRDLVRQVAAKLDLGRDKEFSAGDGSFLQKLVGLVGLGDVDGDQPVREQVVDKVAKNLSVYPVSGARVIGIEFVSTNPDRAANVANGFVDAYFDIQRGAKRDQNRQAVQYLSEEIERMRDRVSEAEGKVEAFRAKAGLLVGGGGTTVTAQQLGEINTQLGSARTQQGEARAKADLIRDLLRQGRPAEALDIANSDVVRSLVQQRSQLAAQIASEGRTLLSQHPRMRELAAQLTGLDVSIRTEAEKLARAFENEAKSAGARVAALEGRLEDQKSVAATANDQDVQLRALDREARTQRDLLEQMLTRYRETSARDNPDALLADARIITKAAAPSEAYFPKKIPTIVLATLGAFVLALFAAATAEVFSAAGRRPEDEDAAPPPPAVGETPVFGRLQGAAYQTPTETAAAPAAAPPPPGLTPSRAESIEVADAALVSALARQLAAMPTSSGALRILATGARADVSVDDVATNLARILSESGRRVVAVDAGGGAPRLGDEATGPGLAELLEGSVTFAQAIHRDRGSRVHVVPRGGTAYASLDAAAQGRLGVVLEALALTYDFVLLSTPGGVGAADAFTPHCEAAILVSNTGAGDVATVDAHDRLKATGIEDVVVLLKRDIGPDDGSRLAA
ncbi:exopolysaccharide transport family protein [Methylopila sp. 73B]|uniref:GumC family protein n=1 Tax=Methylopila sp. 73B TaxID=1120792 RepID=UPI000381AA4E|nr:exopolysaccharide transport family protein [Methylopila sp. 73B]